MRLISSKWTFFYKKIFPAIWFLGIVGILIGGICAEASSKSHNAPPAFVFIAFAAFMGFIGYMLMKNLVFDLLDEVWDEGDSLILVNGGQRETVLLLNIINVSDTYMINPQRISLLLREPCRFGREVVFTPASGFRFLKVFKRNPIAQELLQRVHKL